MLQAFHPVALNLLFVAPVEIVSPQVNLFSAIAQHVISND
jgi:hypothetical protein